MSVGGVPFSKYETYNLVDDVCVASFHRMYVDGGGGLVFGNGSGVGPDTSAR
jgi:hypothetical protein